MIFTQAIGSGGLPLLGAYLIDLQKYEDSRGFFARAWCEHEFKDQGLQVTWVQANLAYSEHKGTLRGMHYQAAPYAEAKLMRCIRGAMYDVILDLRPNSSTFRHWFGAELSADNRRALYVPEGFAHGYLTLVDHTETFYPVSQFYTPDAEGGVRWNDTAFGIDWPITEGLILSDKDQSWPDFAAS
jgi:dTDP-4-dehydrorhamnose 3,5-epimerase